MGNVLGRADSVVGFGDGHLEAQMKPHKPSDVRRIRLSRAAAAAATGRDVVAHSPLGKGADTT
jgi:hypothetical protein